MKRFFAIIMCALIVATALPFAVFADTIDYDSLVDRTITRENWVHECLTDCNGEDASPIIIVPGIMQSQVYVTDTDGNYIMTSEKTAANNYNGFPVVEGMDMSFMFDTNQVTLDLKDKISDILKCIVKNDTDGLYDIITEVLDSATNSHYFAPDGTRVNGVSVDEYWYSCEVARHVKDRAYKFAKGYSKDEDGNVKPTEKYKSQYDFIVRQVDMSSYIEKYGYDHVYYYAYSSFGNILEAASGLNEYIDMVKMQTGHDKVSICFISLGGTIANTYINKYCRPDDIDRIILAACALDGSYLLSDLMSANSTLGEGEVLYNDLIPNIVSLVGEEYMSLAYLGNTVARAIPQKLFSEFLTNALTKAIDGALAKLLRNCQSMWALVPSAVYPELSQKYISDESHADLKKMTDEYYEIQKNAAATLKMRQDQGVDIFIICGYDLELPALINHYNLSSDNIIQASSTSCGGTFAPVGQVLTNEQTAGVDSKYLSPDGIVNASTCALPDKTFFVRGQSHLKLQSSTTDVIELCVQIATNHNLKNATTDSCGYKQFSEYRDLSTVKSLISKYENALANGEVGKLSDKKRQAVEEGYEKATALILSREWDSDETRKVEQEFYVAMEKAKLLGDGATSSFAKYKLLPFITKLMKKLSDIFFKIFKGNDYWLF